MERFMCSGAEVSKSFARFLNAGSRKFSGANPWRSPCRIPGVTPAFRFTFTRGIVRMFDYCRVPHMTFAKRERRRKHLCKSRLEREEDKGWHPELCTYNSEAAKMYALYFYNLFAYPWERGSFERFVDELERKYYPDEHLDALVPLKDPEPVVKQRPGRKNKAPVMVKSSISERFQVVEPEHAAMISSGVEKLETPPGPDDDWEPVGESSCSSSSSGYAESVCEEPPRVQVPGALMSSKSPVIMRGMELPETWDGPLGTVILVDKPIGWTSFTVCAKLRKLLKVEKVGHAGTLDPMATGLLVICIGKATKMIDRYQAMRKVYSGTMRIGEATPSYDADTMVSERLPWEHVTDEDMQIAKEEFIGTIRQVPPIYSAIKVEGERMYEKARRGETCQLPPRLISIDDLSIERDLENRQDFHFKVVCSKGTYVRSLCYDLGQAVNTCAHMLSLRREKIGDLSVEDAWDFSEFGKHFAHEFMGNSSAFSSSTPRADDA